MIHDPLAILTRWATQMAALEAAERSLRQSVGLDPDAPLPRAIADVQMLATEAVAEIVGDEQGWLYWYWLENDLGAKGFTAMAPRWKAHRKIHTVKRLLQIIEATA